MQAVPHVAHWKRDTLCLKIVCYSSKTLRNGVSLNGARETGWYGHATSMRPARPALPCTLNFNMGACEVRMASEFKK